MKRYIIEKGAFLNYNIYEIDGYENKRFLTNGLGKQRIIKFIKIHEDNPVFEGTLGS